MTTREPAVPPCPLRPNAASAPPAAPARRLWAAAALGWGLAAAAAPAAAAVTLQVRDADIAAGTGAQLLQGLFGLSAADAAAAGPQLEAQIGQAAPALISSFSSQINQRFASLDTAGVLRAMANAGSGAARLQPSDYATDASVASLSAGAGVSGNRFSPSDLHISSLNDANGELLERGISGSAGATLTFHLRSLPLPRWRYFDPTRMTVAASYMKLGPYQFDSDVSCGLSNWGVRLSYQLLAGHSWARRGLARWGGLQVGLGLAHSSLDLRFKGSLPNIDPVQEEVGADVPLGLRLTFGGDADLSFRLRSWSVPLEVWSHLQLGYLLTLYGGLGLDYNTSTASFDADLVSRGVDLEAYSTRDASLAPRVIAQPEATLDATDLGHGVHWDGRTFVGLQVNLLYLAVFAQASIDTSHNLSASAGLRAFY